MSHLKLYVVRIWHPSAGGFRASVRRVDDDEARHFDRADDVARFLASDTPAELPHAASTANPTEGT